MRYKNAEKVLPEDLLKQVREYIQGEYLYVSKADGSKKKWGEKSGSRKALTQRNQAIRRSFQEGLSLEELSEEYCLAVSTIKSIVYKKNK